jgi:hypothetical protein
VGIVPSQLPLLTSNTLRKNAKGGAGEIKSGEATLPLMKSSLVIAGKWELDAGQRQKRGAAHWKDDTTTCDKAFAVGKDRFTCRKLQTAAAEIYRKSR